MPRTHNLALNRPATQSSRCMFSRGSTLEDDASGAVNGTISGGASFHTDHDRPSWWMVDLEGRCEIDQIVIYNTVELAHRLTHFSVFSSEDGRHWRLIYKKADDSIFGGADGRPLVLDFDGLVARNLKVQQDKALFLHFDEFQVFGVRSDVQIVGELYSGEERPPTLRGVCTPEFQNLDQPALIGTRGQHDLVELMPTMLSPSQIPAEFSDPPTDIIAAEHYQYPPPPPVKIYAIAGGQIWGAGVTTLENHFFMPKDCVPGYFARAINSDLHGFDIPLLAGERWRRREILIVDEPVACVVNPNMVYGHFLLEMLPRFFVLGLLQQLGATFKVALPCSAPEWIRPFVDLYFPPEMQIWYGTGEQLIKAPSVIIPSMMHEEHNFHPAFRLMIADLRVRLGLPAIPNLFRNSTTPRRIYLSRGQFGGSRRLQNADDVESLMQKLGFAIICPEKLGIRDQVEIFAGADIVVGEYSSALHNTLFCRPGTRIVALDFYSWYQSAIGRLLQLPHTFIAPADGEWRHWRGRGQTDRTFSVDLSVTEALMRKMVSENG